MGEAKQRGPGRPRTREEAESRRYVGFTVPLALKDALEAAAKTNRQSLSAEAVSRLEQSFHPLLPVEDVKEALTLLWIYKHEGIMALTRYLINVEGDPDEAEQAMRASRVRHAADNPKPRAGWLPLDELPTEAPPTAYTYTCITCGRVFTTLPVLPVDDGCGPDPECAVVRALVAPSADANAA